MNMVVPKVLVANRGESESDSTVTTIAFMSPANFIQLQFGFSVLQESLAGAQSPSTPQNLVLTQVTQRMRTKQSSWTMFPNI